MSGYFKPWRRKLGVATLIMACALMGAWLRSLKVHDYVTLRLPHREHEGFALQSMNGHFSISRIWCAQPVSNNWAVTSLSILRTMKLPNGDSAEDLLYRLNRDGSVSHWSIVIPLTLLSAYLLLSKPGLKRKTPEADLA